MPSNDDKTLSTEPEQYVLNELIPPPLRNRSTRDVAARAFLASPGVTPSAAEPYSWGDRFVCAVGSRKSLNDAAKAASEAVRAYVSGAVR
jgi:hypothetical protein